MTGHRIVSHDEWIAARKDFLAKEKAFTRLRDELSQARRALPWERVEKNYVFETDKGHETLADLFGAKSQLIIYHFMFDPDWEIGCKSCSFWADNANFIIPHLNQRDVSFAVISRAPLAKLRAQAAKQDWTFKWVSSNGCDFNYDFGVSFTEEAMARGEAVYNYGPKKSGALKELPGISVFIRDGADIFHTYSTYGRGLDMMNVAYHYLDIAPKGRDEDGLPHPMQWVKHRFAYAR